jgi:hypothetical protein
MRRIIPVLSLVVVAAAVATSVVLVRRRRRLRVEEAFRADSDDFGEADIVIEGVATFDPDEVAADVTTGEIPDVPR